MFRKLLWLVLSITMVGLLAFWWMGGFSSLVYTLETYPAIRLQGEEFTGRPTQKELEEMFYTYRDMAIALDTPLFVVNYQLPDSVKGVRQFIGVPAHEADSAGLREWPAGAYVRVVLTRNLLVTPSPEKVQEEAGKHAASEGRNLSGESIEIYRKGKETVVLFPLD